MPTYQEIRSAHVAGKPPGTDPQRASETFDSYKLRMKAAGFNPDINVGETDEDYEARLATYVVPAPYEYILAASASYAQDTDDFVTNASYADTCGSATSTTSASYAEFADSATTASYADTAASATTASYVNGVVDITTLTTNGTSSYTDGTYTKADIASITIVNGIITNITMEA